MKKILRFLIPITVVLAMFYFSIGFFCIQPIGAIPDGATVMYFRLGLNVSFISSADGILLENGQQVTILGRLIVLGKFGEIVAERKIVSLPYSKEIYLISTKGVEFSR